MLTVVFSFFSISPELQEARQSLQSSQWHCQLRSVEAILYRDRRFIPSSAGTRHLPPHAERAISERSVVGRVDEVPPDSKQVSDDSVN